MNERALVTNFAYGTGPYLRTTELALAFNDELEARGHERLRIIVPWVYGEKQRSVMLEEFGTHLRQRRDEIVLDPGLGAELKRIFYRGTERYAEALERWLSAGEDASRASRAHLSGPLEVETLAGDKLTLDGRAIALELNRSPRVRYDVAPAYSTTFGYVADILERALTLPPGTVDVDRKLLERGTAFADRIERAQALHCMAYPATFSFSPDYSDRYGATLVPPTTNLPEPATEPPPGHGIYVTVTGIEGLERLYAEARALGLALYSNDPATVAGSVRAPPSTVASSSIRLHFARAGWGSLWLSLLLGTPVLVPRYDASDDPEIYFNNLALTELGFGIVYDGQPLSEVLARAPACEARAARLRDEIVGRFGTLSGNQVCAKLLVAQFLTDD